MTKLTEKQIQERKAWVRLWLEGKQLQQKSKHDTDSCEWYDILPIDSLSPAPAFDVTQFVYRQKPAPLEFWVNVYEDSNNKCGYRYLIHSTEWSALEYSTEDTIKTAVHVKEVIEDEKD